MRTTILLYFFCAALRLLALLFVVITFLAILFLFKVECDVQLVEL